MHHEREHQTLCANRKIPQRLIETNLIQYLLAISLSLLAALAHFAFSSSLIRCYSTDFCLDLLMFGVYAHSIVHSFHCNEKMRLERDTETNGKSTQRPF